MNEEERAARQSEVGNIHKHISCGHAPIFDFFLFCNDHHPSISLFSSFVSITLRLASPLTTSPDSRHVCQVELAMSEMERIELRVVSLQKEKEALLGKLQQNKKDAAEVGGPEVLPSPSTAAAAEQSGLRARELELQQVSYKRRFLRLFYLLLSLHATSYRSFSDLRVYTYHLYFLGHKLPNLSQQVRFYP